ncbi:plasmid recombination protein [Rheinheimera baltica]|uniref:plasmid recombination protein n=1 Tax=Rheinheimera baltica TaxID=67576 RepID=UPI000489B999|nr:plasmid recombination protein [Rheinheimera baltica]
MSNNYAILRTKKIKSFAALAAMTAHWHRTRPTKNADPKRTKYNRIIHGNKSPYIGVKDLLKKKGITKLRKNGVLAIEYVLAFSPEYLKDSEGKYLPDCSASTILAGSRQL